MRNTLPHLLIATLLGGSTVAGLEVISPSPASERVSTAPDGERIGPLPGSQWFLFSRLSIGSAQALLD
jgi:hypothetical protein